MVFHVETKARKISYSTDRCKKTGKIKYKSATAALDALAKWFQRDPDACWDLKRFRVYQCENCHKFHLGRYRG